MSESNFQKESSLKSFEGKVSDEYSEHVSAERIRLFCEAVGADSSMGAPPTFLTVFRRGEFDLFDQLGLQLSNILHGEQQYSYQAEIHAGDDVKFITTLSSVLEKKGGAGKMSFLTFETTIEVSKPVPRQVGHSKTLVIVRERSSS